MSCSFRYVPPNTSAIAYALALLVMVLVMMVIMMLIIMLMVMIFFFVAQDNWVLVIGAFFINFAMQVYQGLWAVPFLGT